jgi:hypothetical protein
MEDTMRTSGWAYLVIVLLLVTSVGLFVRGAKSDARIAEQEAAAVASVKQIMDGIMGPAVEVVFNAVSWTVTSAGVEERQPRTAAEWAVVGANAAALAESGNLMLLESRLKDREDDWIAMTRAMIDAAVIALKATEAHDAEALLDSGEALRLSCDTCHLKYNPPKS